MLSHHTGALFFYCILLTLMHMTYYVTLRCYIFILNFYTAALEMLLSISFLQLTLLPYDWIHLSKYYLFSIIYNRVSHTITWWLYLLGFLYFEEHFSTLLFFHHDTLSWLFPFNAYASLAWGHIYFFRLSFTHSWLLYAEYYGNLFSMWLLTFFSLLTQLIVSMRAFYLNAQLFVRN